jgi:hypothetical protein
MCLQVPDDLTPLLFQLLSCVLINQRVMMKILDPQSEHTQGGLTMNDSVFSVLPDLLQRLKATPLTPPKTAVVSSAPDVKFDPVSNPSESRDYERVNVPGATVSSVGSDATSSINLSCHEKVQRPPPPSTSVEPSNLASGMETAGASHAKEKQPPSTQYRASGGFVGDFDRNVAAAREEQKSLQNIVLIRGVLDEAVAQGEELELAQTMLSPCSHLASATSAFRIGTQQNILRVELDKPLARAVVDFFWTNRQLFPSPTMCVTPSRAPSVQLAVRRLHQLQKILERRLPQLKARIVKGRGLLLRGTNHFSAFASMAPGLVLSNGDVISSSLLLENPDHPLDMQNNLPTHSYYKAHDHFVDVD